MIFKDQLGNELTFSDFPKRIVSLVPSQTELLHDLGAGDRVVGITKFCIHPDEWYRSKTRVGGTKNAKKNVIAELKPDLIIGNKEENDKNNIAELTEIAPVWMSDIYNLNDALAMIGQIGEIINETFAAKALIEKIQRQKEHFLTRYNPLLGKTVLYLIWKNPYMAAGKQTFIDDLLTNGMGMKNLLIEKRYPELQLEELQHQPDYIFLSSEPYPFKSQHISELQSIFPSSKILLVDGELFSWYGSRLCHTFQYFEELKMYVSK
jgi:ABC-type Fe3+-hydroxamate transport system substrate-binding protein